jgi:hypothetical protein
MQRLVATLQVIVDDASSWPSHYQSPQFGEPHKLVLNPNADKDGFKEMGFVLTEKSLPSIMAHELGHFVAQLTGVPSHNTSRYIPPPVRLQAEKDAWELAEKMVPVDSEVKEIALNTYRKQAQTQMPSSFQQWPTSIRHIKELLEKIQQLKLNKGEDKWKMTDPK